jgi:Lrp/AsnC family transcriptional regulator for asnA, asnC and gidA
MKGIRSLDRLDRKILRIITGNARMPFKEVAEECGVSRAAVHQRVLRMIDAKAVTGSGYHVNPEALGYKSCTYVGVKLERGSLYRDVIPELSKISEIVECHYTTGPYTLLVKLYARDNDHLMELINSRIQEIPGVTTTETMISLRQDIKRDVPVDESLMVEEIEDEAADGDEGLETELLIPEV